jgi:NADPH2:quinone reductase
MEAAGTVTATAPDVTEVRTGDRVAYAPHIGAYAEYAAVPAERLVKLPGGMDSHSAAATMLQGMTAHYLALSTYPLKKGDTALVHAAAGGVGLLLIQIAKMRGARVFGTVSTQEKAALAREAGADEVILYTEKDFEAEVMRLTNGKGVNVVYDSVAKTTFDKSLNCVGVRGVLALFGQSSGPVPPLDPARLVKNAIFLTRPGLGQYTATRAELLQRAGDLFDWIASGKLKLRISRTLPLKDAAEAHRLLEGRKTTGKVLLIP